MQLQEEESSLQPAGSSIAYKVFDKCLHRLVQDKWSSAYDVRTILLSIQSLLGEPNIRSSLNPQAALLWSNLEEHRKMVEKLYKSPVA
ncbi:ubiquitin-conjugating enzyme E2 20-like [Vicia villosa]|uniref:ubiquitin-conjugating enzyme E2 20-like n=1 Tax=Vicia villosa TaxID=3911 RepID=UPI00273B8DF2|nr:ubiquitin-conjugating enzyme E2 20-like [Vicia villosa]